MSVDFKKYIITNWRIITLVILATIFFFAYAWLPYQTSQPIKFASPDATANYFWTKQYTEMSLRESVSDRSNLGNNEIASLSARNDNGLTYFEPLNLVANDTIIPRSVKSENGTVKPVSFLGIILIYGWLAKIFSSSIIIYLTPLLAVIGVLFFYGIIKKIFNSKIAFISALFLFLFAPYWYYTSRSMFHNVLFVDLVLIGIYLSLRGAQATKQSLPCRQAGRENTGLPRSLQSLAMTVLSGIFIGLAIITRVAELIWLAPAILLIIIFYFKEIKWDKLIIFSCGIILALLPMFYYNQILYGDFLKFGYSHSVTDLEVPNSSPSFASSELDSNTDGIASSLRFAPLFAMTDRILPFGFHPRAAVHNFINYFVIMFWYLFWPALIGGLWLLYKYKENNKQHWLYIASLFLISAILIIFYGSWAIQDNINPNSITIGNSYTRYWLPMYLMSIPLAVLFLTKITELIKQKYVSNILLVSLIIIFAGLNIQATVFAKEEGLLAMKNNIIKDTKLAENIIAQTEAEAIIINKHFDKYLWPERKVIIDNLSNESYYQIYTKLINRGLPLYYYGFIWQPEAFINLNDKFNKAGLQVEVINLDEENKLGLYRLIKKP